MDRWRAMATRRFLPRRSDVVSLCCRAGQGVARTHWRRGVATALLSQIEREAIAWGATRLHVLAGQMALGFYRARGFEKLGEQKTQFGPIAFLMAKPVRPQ